MAKICLDAGHWGDYNQSPALPQYFESRAMWQLHLMLREDEKSGFEVVLTRERQEEDMPLTRRGELARGSDLLLSLHSNAVGDSVNEEIDYPVGYVSVSKEADEIGLKLSRTVEKVMGTLQSARIEHKHNSSKTADYYGVLRGAQSVGVPGVILEHSFHTNSRAAAFLLKEENLRALAKAEAEVLAEYFGVSKPAAAPAPPTETAPEPPAATEPEPVGVDTPEPRYKYLKDVPASWDENGNPRAAIAKLMSAGILKGSGKDEGGEIIDLSRDMLRLIIMLYRAGAFGDV